MPTKCFLLSQCYDHQAATKGSNGSQNSFLLHPATIYTSITHCHIDDRRRAFMSNWYLVSFSNHQSQRKSTRIFPTLLRTPSKSFLKSRWRFFSPSMRKDFDRSLKLQRYTIVFEKWYFLLKNVLAQYYNSAHQWFEAHYCMCWGWNKNFIKNNYNLILTNTHRWWKFSSM